MATAVPFKLITPVAVKFDGEAELVIATGTEGEIGILANHAPYLTALKPGVLRANVRDGEGARGFGAGAATTAAGRRRYQPLEAGTSSDRFCKRPVAAQRRAVTVLDDGSRRASVAPKLFCFFSGRLVLITKRVVWRPHDV